MIKPEFSDHSITHTYSPVIDKKTESMKIRVWLCRNNLIQYQIADKNKIRKEKQIDGTKEIWIIPVLMRQDCIADFIEFVKRDLVDGQYLKTKNKKI